MHVNEVTMKMQVVESTPSQDGQTVAYVMASPNTEFGDPNEFRATLPASVAFFEAGKVYSVRFERVSE